MGREAAVASDIAYTVDTCQILVMQRARDGTKCYERQERELLVVGFETHGGHLWGATGAANQAKHTPNARHRHNWIRALHVTIHIANEAIACISLHAGCPQAVQDIYMVLEDRLR